MKPQIIALDVYGTLIDTSGVLSLLQELVGEQAQKFADLWRSKQLEYSFRRGLMNQYVDFSIVTKEALVYSCQVFKIELDADAINRLLHQYRILPSFDDAQQGVELLKQSGHSVYAYSNGSRKAITELLTQAEVLPLLDGVVSMEDVKTFKPNPIGYQHFCQSANADPQNAWLVSGNNFDVIGAKSYGMQAAWLRRSNQSVIDPMGFDPTITISTLSDLSNALDQYLS